MANRENNTLNVRQQVWLTVWAAAIQSGKYNPRTEAATCLAAFDEEFGRKSDNTKGRISVPTTPPPNVSNLPPIKDAVVDK